MGSGQPTVYCPYVVAREGDGSGVVTVTKLDGSSCTILFSRGRATGAESDEADARAFSASKEGGLSIIRVGGERYEIPDAVIYGG